MRECCSQVVLHSDSLEIRVVRYQILSDTEQILDLLEIRILENHQLLSIHRSKMTAAFIDDDVNNPHISTLVFIVSISNFDKFSLVSNFSANIGKPFPSPDDLEFSCYETLFPTYSCENPHLAFVSKRRLWVKIHFSFPVFPGICILSVILFPRLRILG